jgi:tripartite ATP-independent transporter DctM subunit
VLLALLALPLAESLLRTFLSRGLPGAAPFAQHLTLWVALVGGALAARDGKLLSLASGELLGEGRWGRAARVGSAAVAAAISLLLARASWEVVLVDREAETALAAGIPVWWAQLVLPLGFLAIGLRLVQRAGEGWRGRAVALLGVAAGLVLGQFPQWLEGVPVWPGLLVVVAATAAGGPIFAALGGAALLLFMADGVPIAAIPAETYRLAVSPILPSIPLFTLTGFVLAQGDASERLLRVFRALFGWIPGGTAVMAAVLCAFFTVFTGGSGVTILALGALLFRALQADGYRDRFSLGLLTASGSLGLLFPPALPLILYGVVAQVPIEDLFLGGVLPGVLLVGLIAAWGMREGMRGATERRPFSWREAGAALWQEKWELLLPVVALGAIFGGFATLVEAAAYTALYALIVELLIRRALPWRQLPAVLVECSVLLGGVLLILGVAQGLTSWMVDAQIPSRLLEWTEGTIDSRIVFLLCLNLLLLAVGCLMDIFSAIAVVVPLILPLGEAFGIHPIHLGILFVANLELGYLTPPVGLNLFLAAYRFERPLLEVWRAAIPPLLILAAGVLLITYVPVLTLGLLGWLGR